MKTESDASSTVSRKRHIAKTFTWRILATSVTFAIGYWITGSLELATSIGVIEFFAKMILYYVHERTWYKCGWGVTKR